MGLYRLIFTCLTAVCALCIVSPSFDPAHAQTVHCSRLEARLASLNGAKSGSSNRRYRKAIKVQKRQLVKLDKILKRNKCAKRVFLFGRSSRTQCGSLRNARSKMQKNLRFLQSKVSGGSTLSKSSIRKERRSIRRAMRRSSCGRSKAQLKKRRKIAEQLFGKKSVRTSRESKSAEAELRSALNRAVLSTQRSKNTFRTLCVRTCDGYFFPVSFSTTTRQFGKDEKACNSLCPGTEMKLYYHRTSTETAEDMISARNGKRYDKLPNAFAYRTKFNPSCSCQYKSKQRLAYSKRPAIDPVWLENSSREGNPLPAFRSRAPKQQYASLGSLRLKSKAPKNDNGDALFLPKAPKVRIIGEAFFPLR